LQLKIELQSKLYKAWLAGLQHLPECRVREVSIGIEKLRFVEQIENIGAELEIPSLGNRDFL
jgi:hypothetical protein